jgi:hypothetical protein
MKYLLALGLVLGLTSCQTAQRRAEGKVTCLESNRVYTSDYVRHGYICEDKADPATRVFGDVDVRDDK